MGGLPCLSDLSIGGSPPINIPWPGCRSPFHFLPSSLAISRARAPSSSSELAFLPPKDACETRRHDDWRPSSMMERRLLELEREGLLRHRTSLTSPEWIAPSADHREPKPPKGYVVSFAKFHHHGLGTPPSRFMRALCHHYRVELQHSSPNAIPSLRSLPRCVRAIWG